MKIDIMNISLNPFEFETYFFSAYYEANDIAQRMKLGMVMAFYKSLFGEEIDFSEVSKLQGEAAYNCVVITLLKSMANWSSFEVEALPFKYAFLEFEYDPGSFADWSFEYKIAFLEQKLLRKLNAFQYHLFKQNPAVIIDVLDWDYPWQAIYVYSRRVVLYFTYAEQNESLICNQFSREHKRIQEALRTMEEALYHTSIPVRVSNEDLYVIGVGMGSDGEYGVSENDWNLNFFLAAYVLEKLLDLAEEYFHFEAGE